MKPLLSVFVVGVALSMLTSCQDRPGGDEGEPGAPSQGKLFECIATRTRGVASATCTRPVPREEGGEHFVEQVDCNVSAPDCGQSETERAALCLDPCPPADGDAACAGTKDNLDSSCEDMKTAVEDCMAGWQTDCRNASGPDFGRGDCVPTLTVGDCSTNEGADAGGFQCREDCDLE